MMSFLHLTLAQLLSMFGFKIEFSNNTIILSVFIGDDWKKVKSYNSLTELNEDFKTNGIEVDDDGLEQVREIDKPEEEEQKIFFLN